MHIDITMSNMKEDTTSNIKRNVVNSSTGEHHEYGLMGKRVVWSFEDLETSMQKGTTKDSQRRHLDEILGG